MHNAHTIELVHKDGSSFHLRTNEQMTTFPIGLHHTNSSKSQDATHTNAIAKQSSPLNLLLQRLAAAAPRSLSRRWVPICTARSRKRAHSIWRSRTSLLAA